MKDLKIKPCREMTLFCILYGVIILFVTLIGATLICVKYLAEYWYIFVGIALGLIVVPSIIFILVRLAYKSKLVFSESGITKYKNGEVVFEVKKEEITELCLKKYTASDWGQAFFVGMYKWKLTSKLEGFGSILSIRYGKCELITDRKDTFPNISTFKKDDIKSSESEFCELISNRDFKKIIKKMDIPFRYL